MTTMIDAHVHLGRWRFNKFCGVSTDMETLVRELRACDIGGVAVTTSDEGDNGALINAARVCPLDCWVFLWARPDDPELQGLVEQHGETVKGIKIHPTLEQAAIADPRWDSVLNLANEAGLMVMMHTGRWQEMAGYGQAMDRAARFPKVRFILSHAGGDTPDLCMGAAEEVMRRGLENVFFDTTGLREHWAIVRAMQKAGHHRYMMGSDFPLAHPAMYIAQYRAMDVPDAWKEDLLGGNARRLMGAPSTVASPEAAPPRPRPHAIGADTTVLVTGAGGPIGVNLTRSLRMASRPLRLIGTDANPLHRPLAITDVCLPMPLASQEGYLERLTEVMEQERVDLVIPTHPTEVRAISALRDQLPDRVATYLPPHEVILAGQDKFRSWELFSKAGVPVPRSIKISTPEDLERAFDELGPPPIWLRGSGVPGSGIGVASLPVEDVGVARAWVQHHQGWGLFMASEFLPGDNLTYLCLWHQGKLWASQTRKRIEYVIPHVSPSGITGAPAVCHTVDRPEVDAIGEATVRAVFEGAAPHGIFFVDLKSDAAGQPRVTEINSGRFGTTIHFYTAAGYNFPELAMDLALGKLPDAPVRNPVPPDTYWLRTLDCGPVLLPGSALETE